MTSRTSSTSSKNEPSKSSSPKSLTPPPTPRRPHYPVKESKTPFQHNSRTIRTATSPKTVNTVPSSTEENKPVVIVIKYDTRNTAYCTRVWSTIGLGLVNVLIGGISVMAIAYTAVTGDIHAGVCTVGVHFFCAEAILSLNTSNGWTMPMHLKHRKFAHVLLQLCGVICTVGGAIYLIVMNERIIGTAHGYFGLATVCLAALSFFTGPLALCMGGRWIKILHMSIGIPAFLVSSVCLCLGMITENFKLWASSPIVLVLIGFVCFNTAFIIITAFLKCVSRIGECMQ